MVPIGNAIVDQAKYNSSTEKWAEREFNNWDRDTLALEADYKERQRQERLANMRDVHLEGNQMVNAQGQLVDTSWQTADNGQNQISGAPVRVGASNDSESTYSTLTDKQMDDMLNRQMDYEDLLANPLLKGKNFEISGKLNEDYELKFSGVSRADKLAAGAVAFDLTKPSDCADFCINYSKARGFSLLGGIPLSTDAEYLVSQIRKNGVKVDPKTAYYLDLEGITVWATATKEELGKPNAHAAPLWPGTGDYIHETELSGKKGWENERWPNLMNMSMGGGTTSDGQSINNLKLNSRWVFTSPPKFYYIPDKALTSPQK